MTHQKQGNRSPPATRHSLICTTILDSVPSFACVQGPLI